MATGTGLDFKIYDEYVQTGLVECIVQNVLAFNGASSNALRLVVEALKGNYDYNAFFQDATIIGRRDVDDSTSDVADTKLTQEEIIGVKLNRSLLPIGMTLDAFRKIGSPNDEMLSRIVGEMFGPRQLQEKLNVALYALCAALENIGTTVTHDGTAANMTHTALNLGNAKMGDQAGKIICYVMHSKPWHDLIGSAMVSTITNVADVAVKDGSTFGLGRNVIVTDSPALMNEDGISSGVYSYNTLGLVMDACEIEDSERTTVTNQIITGKPNLINRIQGEYAYSIKVKGVQYDVSNGGKNPTDATIATATNWDQVATSIKSCPGVLIETK